MFKCKDIEIRKIEIAKLKLEEGDIVIVKSKDQKLPPHAIACMKEAFCKIIPNNQIVVLNGLDIAILTHNDIADVKDIVDMYKSEFGEDGRYKRVVNIIKNITNQST